jgi:SAM-dependent methyltransferase
MCKNIDFKKYYDEHDTYVRVREKDSEEYVKYKNDVIHWKLKYLKEVAGELEPASILEIGCATGIVLNHAPFSTHKTNRWGIDISEPNINTAKSDYPDLNFFAGTLEDIIKIDRIKFELVLLSDILEHIEDDIELLRKCSEVGENILLNLPLEKCEEYKNRNYGINDAEGHLRAYDINDARKIIEKAGMKDMLINRYSDITC